MKIALVHDDLVQWGGAERVLAAISEIYPNAPIFTSVYDYKNPLLKKFFANKRIITSFIQKIPAWQTFYKGLLPFYPLAFESFDFSEYDLVLSQTTRSAKAIITKPNTKHVCYCHTPPRYLWNYSGFKIPKIMKPYISYCRIFDSISSKRVDYWLAGSENAKHRIKDIYHVDSDILPPFVDLEKFQDIKPFNGGYYLVISRLNSYKRVDLAVEAANILQVPLKIVGNGPQENNLRKIAGPTVDFIGSVDERTLVLLIAGCRALIVGNEEDFGLTPLEAQALGKPVVAYGSGGVLETVLDGQTGILFKSQSVEVLTQALVKLDKEGYNGSKCQSQANKFSKSQFMDMLQAYINSLN